MIRGTSCQSSTDSRLRMHCLVILSMLILLGGAKEHKERRNKVRFPSETQGQMPSSANPFGQVNSKGYLEGGQVPYFQEMGEFHQTMPPPLQATPYGPPKSVSGPWTSASRTTYQGNRHRFSSERTPLNYLSKSKAKTGHSGHTHQYHMTHHHDVKPEHFGLTYKYPVQGQPKYQFVQNHLKKVETSYNSPYSKRPQVFPQVAQQHKQSSEDEAIQSTEDTNDQGIPDWQIKFQDSSINSDLSSLYKKGKINRPQFHYNHQNKYDESHSLEDFSNYQNTFFDELNEKRFFQPQWKYKPRGEIASVYNKPPHDVPQRQKSNLKYISTEASFSLEDESKERFNEYDHPLSLNIKSEDNSGISNTNFGTDWVPINAPEGVLPAKSYEIPAPDLSREQPLLNNRRLRPSESGNLVYGVPKSGGGAEDDRLVSAVVRVKQ